MYYAFGKPKNTMGFMALGFVAGFMSSRPIDIYRKWLDDSLVLDPVNQNKTSLVAGALTSILTIGTVSLRDMGVFLYTT